MTASSLRISSHTHTTPTSMRALWVLRTVEKRFGAAVRASDITLDDVPAFPVIAAGEVSAHARWEMWMTWYSNVILGTGGIPGRVSTCRHRERGARDSRNNTAACAAQSRAVAEP